MRPPRSRTACSSLPPEGAAAPAAWQSQIRGPRLKGMLQRQLPILSRYQAVPVLLPLNVGAGRGEGCRP